MIAFTIADFCLAMLHPRQKEISLIYRLQGPLRIYGDTNRASVVTSKWFGRFGLLFVLVVVSSFIAGIMGQSAAIEQTSFLVPVTRPDAIVVRIYGEKAICAVIDPTSKKLTKKFFVTDIDQEKIGVLELKQLGQIAGRD